MTTLQEKAARVAARKRSVPYSPKNPVKPAQHAEDDRVHGFLPQPDADFDGVALMLMLDKDSAEAVSQFGSIKPGDMHCTLNYLGSSTKALEDEGLTVQRLRDVAHDLASQHNAFQGELSGLLRFSTEGPNDPVVLSVNSKPVVKLYADSCQALKMNGFDDTSEYSYTPHVTLGYIPAEEDTPLRRWTKRTVTFDRLRVGWGGNTFDYVLGNWDNNVVESKDGKMLFLEEKVIRHVRTEAGVKKYGQAIGTVITKDGALPNLKAGKTPKPSIMPGLTVLSDVTNTDTGKTYHIFKSKSSGQVHAYTDELSSPTISAPTQDELLKKLSKEKKGPPKKKAQHQTYINVDDMPPLVAKKKTAAKKAAPKKQVGPAKNISVVSTEMTGTDIGELTIVQNSKTGESYNVFKSKGTDEYVAVSKTDGFSVASAKTKSGLLAKLETVVPFGKKHPAKKSSTPFAKKMAVKKKAQDTVVKLKAQKTAGKKIAGKIPAGLEFYSLVLAKPGVEQGSPSHLRVLTVRNPKNGMLFEVWHPQYSTEWHAQRPGFAGTYVSGSSQYAVLTALAKKLKDQGNTTPTKKSSAKKGGFKKAAPKHYYKKVAYKKAGYTGIYYKKSAAYKKGPPVKKGYSISHAYPTEAMYDNEIATNPEFDKFRANADTPELKKAVELLSRSREDVRFQRGRRIRDAKAAEKNKKPVPKKVKPYFVPTKQGVPASPNDLGDDGVLRVVADQLFVDNAKAMKAPLGSDQLAEKNKAQVVNAVSARMAAKIDDQSLYDTVFKDTEGLGYGLVTLNAGEAEQWVLANKYGLKKPPNASTDTWAAYGIKMKPEEFLHAADTNDYAVMGKVFDKDIRERLISLSRDPNGDSKLPTKQLVAKTSAQVYIDQWADSSGDHNSHACALQYRAIDVFGVKNTHIDNLSSLNGSSGGFGANPQQVIDGQGPLMDAFLESVYEETQDMFKKKGITEVVIHRGMRVSTKLPENRLGVTKVKEQQAIEDFKTFFKNERKLREKERAATAYPNTYAASKKRGVALKKREKDFHEMLANKYKLQKADAKRLYDMNADRFSQSYNATGSYKPPVPTRLTFLKYVQRRKLVSQPLSSWATAVEATEEFGPVLFTQRVSVENIWSTALTGAGCSNEKEFILLGGQSYARVELRNM